MAPTAAENWPAFSALQRLVLDIQNNVESTFYEREKVKGISSGLSLPPTSMVGTPLVWHKKRRP
jgi:hypothetical protein